MTPRSDSVNDSRVSVQTFIRIAAVAIALSTLSFAAGVAGDLSNLDQARSGQRVVLRIPPEIPTDAVRAGPLAPVISTASIDVPQRSLRTTAVAWRRQAAVASPALDGAVKPPARIEAQLARVQPKQQPVLASLKGERESG